MKGKAHCPHCKQKVVIEAPDQATGVQLVNCPNCTAPFKVNVDERYSWEEDAPLIHPSVHIRSKSMKPPIAGLLLIIVCLLGLVIGSALFFSMDIIEDANISGRFRGIVVTADGEELPGVEISVVDHPEYSVVTDMDGKFSLANITSGKQTLLLARDGYKTLKAEVFIVPWDVSLPRERLTMEEGIGTTGYESLVIKVLELGPVLAVIIAILSVGALIGAVMAFLRKHFPIAVVGAVCGIVAGFFSIIGIPLGIVALILLLLAKEEFQGAPTEMKY